jgi:superkiller protein 3
VDEAIEEIKLIQTDPNDAAAHHELGFALKSMGRWDEAIQEYHKAIRLDPKLAEPHSDLGIELYCKGQVDEAIQEYREAIRLDPKAPVPHNRLGLALYAKGQVDEAVKEYGLAIAIAPEWGLAHENRGTALRAKGRLDEAIEEYQRALFLDPELALVHHKLAFDPTRVLHHNFALALSGKGRGDEAIEEFRKAVDLNPKFAQVHNDLAAALRAEGRLHEAIAEYHDAIHLDDLTRLLLRAASGTIREFGNARAFDDQHRGAGDPRVSYRFNAACASALAGCGQGAGAAQLDDMERAQLRSQALIWLRADLASWTRPADGKDPADRAAVRQIMQRWPKEADLAGVRDRDGLGRLPDAERKEWRRLWDDVAALHTRAGGATP